MTKIPLKQSLNNSKQHEEKNINLTPLRKEIFDLIQKQKRPVKAYDLLRLLRKTRENAEPPTVYRALKFLEQEHLIHRLESNNAYMSCAISEDTHQSQILLCNTCGDASEIADRSMSDAIKRFAKTNKFILGNETFELRGTCHKCL